MMYFLSKAKALICGLFKNKAKQSSQELPNLYGSGGGTSYVKGLSNDEAQALFVAWDKKQKQENREGFKPKTGEIGDYKKGEH